VVVALVGLVEDATMGNLWHIKGAGEAQVLAAVMARVDQRTALARTVAHLY
jgi:hypothetical protein